MKINYTYIKITHLNTLHAQRYIDIDIYRYMHIVF